MNSQRTLKFGLFALAVALFVAAAPAGAQQLYKATFDLPFEAQWGKTVLEQGQYTLVLEQALGQKIIRLHGATELAILAGPSTPEPLGDNGKLTFVNVNGVYLLKKFDAGFLGQSYIFPTYKPKEDRAALDKEAPTTVVVGTR